LETHSRARVIGVRRHSTHWLFAAFWLRIVRLGPFIISHGKDYDPMDIEVKFIDDGRHVIKVRSVGEWLWDDLKPGDIHADSGWEFEELRGLGEGRHTVNKKPLR